MPKDACSLCGSRDWPRLHTDCPLCRAEPDSVVDDYDGTEYDGDAMLGEFENTKDRPFAESDASDCSKNFPPSEC